ncbi:MAG: AtpZ/AtpI family protein [Blautia sp.]|nr:AtpZ/AtpI family protein [Blautia sp.]
MKDLTEIVKHLTLVTQFGLSLITPLLLCLGLSWWAFAKLQVGGWVFIPGFFFGLGGSAMVAYKLFLGEEKRQEKEKKKEPPHISFNQHL